MSRREPCPRLARATLRIDLWDDARTERVLAVLSDDGLRMDLAAALESLPTHYREIIVLRDFEELTVAEIAERLDATAATVKSRLHRARELIREFLVA